jgi:hypothetical protein
MGNGEGGLFLPGVRVGLVKLPFSVAIQEARCIASSSFMVEDGTRQVFVDWSLWVEL